MTRRELIRVLSGGVAGIPAVQSVERLTLQPEDIIVLKYCAALPLDAARRLRETVEAAIPGHKCIVLANGLDIQVIRKV